jgi:methyl-accepting chemotaxis protein
MFRTLKIWQKLALVAIVMVIPLAALMVLFVGSRNEQIDSARSELASLDYEASLRRLLETLPAHRDLMSTVLGGDTSKTGLAESAARKVDEAFSETSRYDELQGQKLRTSEKWNALRTRWTDLKAQARSLQARDCFNRHIQLASDVIDYMRFVADRGGLTTDPQLDSYYLWDLMLSGAINGAEYANGLRGYVTPAAPDDSQLSTLSRSFSSPVRWSIAIPPRCFETIRRSSHRSVTHFRTLAMPPPN